MGQGLRVWDAAGNLILDSSTAAGKFLGVVTVTAATGSVTDAGFADGAAWFCHIPIGASYSVSPPAISVSGTTLSWSGFFGTSCLIVYGIY